MLRKTDVVVFDFDGTLSARDSNVEFAKYCFRHSLRPWLFLPLMMVCGVIRWIKPHGLWWRENIRRFLTPEMVKKFAPDFIKAHKRERFGWARERVQAERDAGRKVVLISASTDYLIPGLVRDMKFDRMGVFCYSREKGTPSYSMKPQVPKKVAKARWKKLMEIQQEISKERNKQFVGKLIPCIIECYSDDGEVIAKTQFDAPEIDGIVNIKTDKHVVPGDIELVKITKSNEYDLFGEI